MPRPNEGFRKKGGQMRVSQPTEMMFYISVALAIISVVLHVMAYMEIDIFPTTGYLILLVSYLVLLAGVTFKGV